VALKLMAWRESLLAVLLSSPAMKDRRLTVAFHCRL
jgi:hypothetical protein